MVKKITIQLDEELIQQAKSYSREKGKSISQIVADYFTLLGKKPSSEITPIVQSLRGSLKGGQVEEEDYRRHLEEKYL
jgi:hypothetical protein